MRIDNIEVDPWEAAHALYWFCSDYHYGQSSDLYRIQCELRYTPSQLDNGNLDQQAADVYDWLAETVNEDDYAPKYGYTKAIDRAEQLLRQIQEYFAREGEEIDEA